MLSFPTPTRAAAISRAVGSAGFLWGGSTGAVVSPANPAKAIAGAAGRLPA